MDRYGYVMGTVPATPGCEHAPRRRLHRPRRHLARHERQDVRPRASSRSTTAATSPLNGQLTMKVADFPSSPHFFKGHADPHRRHDAGADDKAGVAEIMTAAEICSPTPR